MCLWAGRGHQVFSLAHSQKGKGGRPMNGTYNQYKSTGQGNQWNEWIKHQTLLMLLRDADSFNKTCSLVSTLTNQKLTPRGNISCLIRSTYLDTGSWKLKWQLWYGIMYILFFQMVQYNGNVSVYEKKQGNSVFPSKYRGHSTIMEFL